MNKHSYKPSCALNNIFVLPASLLPVPLWPLSVFRFPALLMPRGPPRSGALSPGCFVQLCRMFPAQKYQPLVVSESQKPDPAPSAPSRELQNRAAHTLRVASYSLQASYGSLVAKPCYLQSLAIFSV